MRCPNCGNEIAEGKKYCGDCGSPIAPTAAQSQPREGISRTAVMIIIASVVVVLIVLIAAFYILVLRTSESSEVTPYASYAKTSVAGGEKISILSITEIFTTWDRVRVQLTDGPNQVEWGTKTSDLDEGYSVTAPYSAKLLGTTYVTLTVTDATGDGLVSGGDYFIVYANPDFSSTRSYSAVLIYEPTGERIGTGMTFYGNDIQVTPAATYSKSAISNGEQINVVAITNTHVPWDDVKVQLTDGTNFAEWEPVSADLDGGSAVSMNYTTDVLGSLTVCCWVYDVGGNGNVSGSDYFRLSTYGGATAFSTSTTYTAVLIYEPTGERIGTGISFAG